ncbi:hypothetical protein [Methanoculleus sp.]|nr:hypothetical protein [Methanoculleus sp.]
MSLLFFPAVAFVLAWPFALITLIGKLEREKQRPLRSVRFVQAPYPPPG